MDRTDQVRRILSTKGLTLYRISQQSAEMFGQSSLFFIPHNLRYDLTVSSGRPSIHQLFALSKITNLRLCDWLTVFVEDAARDCGGVGEFEDQIGRALAGSESEDGTRTVRFLLAVFGIDVAIARDL